MKNLLKILVMVLPVLFAQNLFGQSESNDFQGLPLRPNSSVLFGKDIVIHDQPDRNQKLVAVCSAYNGWLYAAYTYQTPSSMSASMTILKSTDSGITWTVLIDDSVSQANTNFTCISLVTTGTSVDNLKLFVVSVFITNPSFPYGSGYLSRYNGETGAFEERLFEETGIYHMAVASDFLYPATNSNSGSLGLLYSKYANTGDSLIFHTSSNAGTSLDNKQLVIKSAVRIKKVSLCYGRTATYPTGRYFVCWEAMSYMNSEYGRIYTSHTEPNFNSPVTFPYQLDNIDPFDAGRCRSPSITCQYNNTDNANGNMTEVILVERYDGSIQRNDVVCYSNNTAATANNFTKFSLTDPTHNNRYPDVCFNPYNSTFLVTYFDSTNHKLPFLTNDLNLTNPNSWNIINPQYNDNTNLSFPYPQVNINYDEQQGMNAWIADRADGKGMAMFDAPYSIVGTPDVINKSFDNQIMAYPNPCNQKVSVFFSLKETGKVTIELFDMVGRPICKITDQKYGNGNHTISYNISEIPAGTYLLVFRSSEFQKQIKLCVIR